VISFVAGVVRGGAETLQKDVVLLAIRGSLRAVEDFRAIVQQADALVIWTPEYAHRVPGSRKHAAMLALAQAIGDLRQ
jgi:NAD(P)H-dependent FMN reductase